MRYGLFLILFIPVVFVLFLAVHHNRIVQTDTPGAAASRNEHEVQPAIFSTDTWGIFNPGNGTLLAGENTRVPRPIASLTKLFTAYAVLESERKNATTSVTWTDLTGEGRAGKLSYGAEVTPYTLLFPLLLESSNDAGGVIDRVLGNEFDDSVVTLIHALELNETHLVDTTGLSPNDVSAVDDLAHFFSYLKRTHSHVLDITRLTQYVGEDIGWINNNPGRTYPNFMGGKHGFTEQAGRTFVGSFSGEGGEIGIVLLGSKNLATDISTALRYVSSHPTLSICYNAGTCAPVPEKISFSEPSHQ